MAAALVVCAHAGTVASNTARAAAPAHFLITLFPRKTETYASQMQTINGVGRAERIQFVTVVSQGTLQASYRVPYAVFAKGERADHLIVVGLHSGELNTIYRIRALLANMTTMSRTSPFFQEHTVAEDATFFDLLKLLGFQDVTVSDGEKITHQVTLK